MVKRFFPAGYLYVCVTILKKEDMSFSQPRLDVIQKLSNFSLNVIFSHLMDTKKEKKVKSPLRIAKERFHGRKNSLFKKAHELGILYETDVYLILRRNHRFYTYKTKDDPSWPPSEKQIVC